MINSGNDIRNILWTGQVNKKCLLIVVAHCDDFEIGCLATVLKLHDAGVVFSIKLLTLCSNDQVRRKEQQNSINYLKKIGIKIDLVTFDYKDTILAENITNIKKDIKECAKVLSDLDHEICVITHHDNDKHQDHACVNDAVTQSLRNHRIITFNNLKYEEEVFIPSFYVKINQETAEKKVAHILQSFSSQKSKIWFNKEVFLSELRMQGVHANCNFAESFFIQKMCI